VAEAKVSPPAQDKKPKNRCGRPTAEQQAAEEARKAKHNEAVELLEAYWRIANGYHPLDARCRRMTWDGREAKALANFFQAAPDVDIPLFRRCLDNRLASEAVNHLALPHMWIMGLQQYALGPLNRYGRPLDEEERDSFWPEQIYPFKPEEEGDDSDGNA
jgi:hypothetical protein